MLFIWSDTYTDYHRRLAAMAKYVPWAMQMADTMKLEPKQ